LAAAYAVVAAIVLTLNFVTQDDIKQFCTEQISTVDMNGIAKTVVDDINLYIDDIDTGIKESVGEHMCQGICKCVPVDLSMWDAKQEAEFINNPIYNFEGEGDNNDKYETFIDCYKEKAAVWE